MFDVEGDEVRELNGQLVCGFFHIQGTQPHVQHWPGLHVPSETQAGN